MTLRSLTFAACLFALAPQLPAFAADAPVAPGPSAGQATQLPHDFPGKARAIAFLEALSRGDTSAAYAMMSDAGRKKTDAATFSSALGPFAKAGITEWRPTSLTVANKAMGYDSDFGFYREMKTTVVGGIVKTRHSGLFAVNFYLVGFGDAWQVHGVQVKSLPAEPGTAMNEPRKG